MKLDNTQVMMMEELETARNQSEKFALLQKYGLAEPKLTKAEQNLIRNEARKNATRSN
jgi:hypothetical protein